jgi:hypothetical protein
VREKKYDWIGKGRLKGEEGVVELTAQKSREGGYVD